MLRLPRIAGTGAVAVALAVLASAATAAAVQPRPPSPSSSSPTHMSPSPGHVSPSPAQVSLTHPRIVAHFDFAAGQTPESIALEPDGSADLSFALARQVARVDKHGDTQILATLPTEPNPATPIVGVAVTTGLVRTHDGVLYVGHNTGTDLTGIYRITPDGEVSRITDGLPSNVFVNGLTLDEEHGVLYAADSFLGKVWRISLDDGAVTTWATGTELERVGFIGANGIKVHGDSVWVTNSDKGTLLRIPVEPDGSAGPISTRATGLAGIDDFTFIGQGPTVLAALNPSNEVALVRPDGTHSIVLTERAGLSNPTAVAIRHQKVYVTSASFSEVEKDPNLLIAHLEEHHP
ncbi:MULTISPECIES: SMP-30/gluconolactonase/LRE family protein [unclassified Streptomyces]|uniref:SMP-30/gluconolactonase/LRE family protein n=1 Tax=unclassified Streptomyces TaxID=2593676 RepID=UPI001BEB8D9A|nr:MULTISPECIES: hypothetical protein [unclassified Streptomyces]MBT2408533.1 hypothetical protein [Streptomyces sp. ISL-21]MBT2612252.1 hypothetical protein [Streptomyces sp. ISL-87]